MERFATFFHIQNGMRVWPGRFGIEHAFDFRLLLDIFGPGVCRSNPRLMKFLLAGLGGFFCFLPFGLRGLLLLQTLGIHGLAVFLPFEPKLLTKLLGADAQQIVETFREAAVVRGLVAQVEGERFLLFARVVITGEGEILETLGTEAEPEMFSELVDEGVFTRRGRLMLFAVGGEEIVEVLLVFGGQDGKLAAETVFEVVARRDGESSGGGRAGAELGILAIGSQAGGRERGSRCTSSNVVRGHSLTVVVLLFSHATSYAWAGTQPIRVGLWKKPAITSKRRR